MKRLWLWFLARYHLSNSAVCEMSKRRQEWNCYHDYQDSEAGFPDHFAPLTCKRCGKTFWI